MKCFVAYLRREFRAGSIYRIDFLLKIAYGLITMYAVRCLWVALYSQSPELVGRDLPSMLTYAMLAAAMDMIFYPSATATAPHLYIMQQMRTGRIDTDLLRPMNLQKQLLLQNAATMVFGALALVLPACALAMAAFGMGLPASALHGAAFLLSFALGFLVLFSMNFLLGLVSVVTTDIQQITWAYNGLISILSGKLVPLWMFPAWMRAAANALPFRCIFETPLNIYTGALQGAALWSGVLLQAAWVLALMALGHFAWAGVHRRLCVQGG